MKRNAAICLIVAGSLMLTGCSGLSQKQDAVYVQPVGTIMGSELSGSNRYAGVVESSKVQKITRDSTKKISELRVKEGDMVKKGDVLFTYDKSTLQMSVDTASLEVEAISNKISAYQAQIKQLRRDKKSASKSEQLSYNLQIQEAELNLTEEQYNLKAKQKELDNFKQSLNHADVTAEVDGLVQSVQDEDSAIDTGSDAFITILETAVQQVRGTVSEMDVATLSEGEPVTIYSRLDDGKTWEGTISKISTESADNAEQEDAGGEEQTGISASQYSFYVTLTSVDGLMVGQHVYIQPGEAPETDAVWLYADYIVKEGDKAYVWAADRKNNLYKQEITLGRHNEESDTYEIKSGLKLEDYITYPNEALQEGQKATLSDGGDTEETDLGSGDAAVDQSDGAGQEIPALPAEGGDA